MKNRPNVSRTDDKRYLIERRHSLLMGERELYKTLIRRIAYVQSEYEYFEITSAYYRTMVVGTQKYHAKQRAEECEAEMRRNSTVLAKYRELLDRYVKRIEDTFAYDEPQFRKYYMNVVVYGKTKEESARLARINKTQAKKYHTRIRKEFSEK